MRRFAFVFLILSLALTRGVAQTGFNYEENKQLLIERALMQYFIILHGDRYDQTHLDGYCDSVAKGADLAALRQAAAQVPEDFNWTNKESKAITGTPFKVGSVFVVELECTDGSTAVVQFIVSGEGDKPYLVVHDHLEIKG